MTFEDWIKGIVAQGDDVAVARGVNGLQAQGADGTNLLVAVLGGARGVCHGAAPWVIRVPVR
jgi:hypothetical protein